MTVAPGAIGAGTEIGQGYTLKDGSGCLTIRVHLTQRKVFSEAVISSCDPAKVFKANRRSMALRLRRGSAISSCSSAGGWRHRHPPLSLEDCLPADDLASDPLIAASLACNVTVSRGKPRAEKAHEPAGPASGIRRSSDRLWLACRINNHEHPTKADRPLSSDPSAARAVRSLSRFSPQRQKTRPDHTSAHPQCELD